jgi:hypothetical protein
MLQRRASESLGVEVSDIMEKGKWMSKYEESTTIKNL